MVLTGVVAAAAVARSARVLAQWRRVPDVSRSAWRTIIGGTEWKGRRVG